MWSGGGGSDSPEGECCKLLICWWRQWTLLRGQTAQVSKKACYLEFKRGTGPLIFKYHIQITQGNRKPQYLKGWVRTSSKGLGVLNHKKLICLQCSSILCAGLPLPSVLTSRVPLGPRGMAVRAGLHLQLTWKNHRAWLPYHGIPQPVVFPGGQFIRSSCNVCFHLFFKLINEIIACFPYEMTPL